MGNDVSENSVHTDFKLLGSENILPPRSRSSPFKILPKNHSFDKLPLTSMEEIRSDILGIFVGAPGACQEISPELSNRINASLPQLQNTTPCALRVNTPTGTPYISGNTPHIIYQGEMDSNKVKGGGEV